MLDVGVSRHILSWARERSGRTENEIRQKFSKWDDWVTENERPNFSQLERIAEYTRVPIGYFFLSQPPSPELPIPDFRVGHEIQLEASNDLLETIYINEHRQAWYEDYLSDLGDLNPLAFVGSARHLSPQSAAARMTTALSYSVEKRRRLRNRTEARVHLIEAFEELGGLVVLNSMVANNTHRMLDLDEFRGFTLHSKIAPLVFVNANDTINGQIFSLLHEYAHVWRGECGISQGGDPLQSRNTDIEQWCDTVASEIAVPSIDIKKQFDKSNDLTRELERLSDRYLCSTLVILIKLKQTNLIPTEGFSELYRIELNRLLDILESTQNSGGGDFYQNQPNRIGRTLSKAIIRDTKFGRTSMTEALRLLRFRRISMFDKYAQRIGEG